MFRTYLARFTLLSMLLLASVAYAAGPYSQLFVKGDSLSDVGNAASLVPPDQRPPDPPFFGQTRATNGPVAVEVLAERLGLSAQASLHFIGAAVGTNYAVVGAEAGDFEPQDLLAQVAAYLSNVGGVADPDALYVVFIGGNDVRAARDARNLFAAWLKVRFAVLVEASAIRALTAAGARHFLLVNVPDIGLLPETRRLAHETGKRHLAATATWLTRVYNHELTRRADRLRARLGIHIKEFDFFSALHGWIANAGALGLINTQDACLASYPLGACNPFTINNYVFFDEIHPTSRVHELLGEALADAVQDAGVAAAAR